ncbi:MAG TPA: tRNA epoxyqueuosine(34) reductase QueG, partial [Candidatus Eisenbacteria bacterium]|nr:tRNA epoxyqueuosine(34) reductase QueG [Candidatus Eisenbacteria bacterium]
ERLREWIAEGRHGTMRWMTGDPSRRADPGATFRKARTVISLATNYYRGGWPKDKGEEAAAPAPEAPLATSGAHGKIARYAWSGDYHKRLRRRMRRLAYAVRALAPGADWYAAVDTAPMLDRAWAERSGVGWIGKNSCVIRTHAGSWCFLSEIVTDLELDPDPPASNHCGTCARCLEACPTRAIVAPYIVDARRCISYLTIEHDGPIPEEFRPLIGTRVFGCDDCQEVCPWNRFAVKSADPGFADRPGQATPLLIPLLSLNAEEFHRRFAGTAVRRAGRNRFVRNVAVALGNAGDPAAGAALRRAAEADPDPDVRSHAVWALGRLRPTEAPPTT